MTITSAYLWFKALHVAFMVTWFAGLFYLPRLFIYHTDASEPADHVRFTVMERRLFIIMSIGAALTALFGFLMLGINQALTLLAWFQIKLGLLVGLIFFHFRCWLWINRLEKGALPDNTRWLRWFNEIPAFFLLAIVALAIVKPF